MAKLTEKILGTKTDTYEEDKYNELKKNYDDVVLLIRNLEREFMCINTEIMEIRSDIARLRHRNPG